MNDSNKALSGSLINKGKTQLEAEILIIKGWIKDLNETRSDNTEALAARQKYNDMLQSRRNLLKTLELQ